MTFDPVSVDPVSVDPVRVDPMTDDPAVGAGPGRPGRPTLRAIPGYRDEGRARVGRADALCAGCGWLAVIATLVPWGPVSFLPVFGFVLVGPGAVVVNRLGVTDPLERAVAAVAVSVATGILVSTLMGYAGWARPSLVVAVLAAATTAAVAAPVVMRKVAR